jgi:glycosyltransferase involved in cell wall biosynthesis
VGPHVSVLLPAWNAGATLGAALASLRRQTYEDWECVVMDDGSTDSTPALASAVAAADARVRVIRTPHRGLVAALNGGLLECRGTFIARMDADDVMHRERFQRQVAALEVDASLAAVGCHVRLFPRAVLSPRRREYEAWLNAIRTADDVQRDAFVECPVAHPTLMLRRDAIGAGYQDRGWPEDYDLVLRLLAAQQRIGVVPRRLLAWRDHPQRHSRRHAAYAQAQFTACKAHYLATTFLASASSYVLWGYGDTGRALRGALAAYGKRPSHIVEVKASRLGQRIHGALVIPISDLPQLARTPVVVSVARAGPRAEIRAAMTAMGFVDGVDFVCAA